MSWISHHHLFSSFQAKENNPHAHKSENIPYESSRNNLKPIRTFGRDISNMQNSNTFMQERILTNAKATKKIKLKYPKNNVSRRQFGFEVSRQSTKTSLHPSVTAKRYISSSSLTDRNK